MMMCGSTRSEIFLNIILLLILVNPLLAVKQSNKKEKIRQQAQEERQSEFVKGKSKFKLNQRWLFQYFDFVEALILLRDFIYDLLTL